MNRLSNKVIRNSIGIAFTIISIATILILLYYYLPSLRIIVVASITAFALRSWIIINDCFTDYLTNSEAPLISLSMISAFALFQSPMLSLISAWLILFIYQYFFLSSQSYSETSFAAMLLSLIFFIIIWYLSFAGIKLYEVIPKVVAGIFLHDDVFIVIACITSIILFFVNKNIYYEWKIITLDAQYHTMLGINTTLLSVCVAIIRTIIGIIIFCSIGWLGVMVTAIPTIRSSNNIASIVMIAIIISAMLLITSFFDALYIIIALVVIDFCYISFFQKRIVCSNF